MRTTSNSISPNNYVTFATVFNLKRILHYERDEHLSSLAGFTAMWLALQANVGGKQQRAAGIKDLCQIDHRTLVPQLLMTNP